MLEYRMVLTARPKGRGPGGRGPRAHPPARRPTPRPRDCATATASMPSARACRSTSGRLNIRVKTGHKGSKKLGVQKGCRRIVKKCLFSQELATYLLAPGKGTLAG